MPTELQIPLKGPKGEPVDLVRTIMSHGVADLSPGHVDEDARAYNTTLALPSAKPRTIRILEGRSGFAHVEVEGRKLGARAVQNLTTAVRQILNLDEDLSEFYALIADDPDLSWASAGAGRMLRTPTVFEAAVKTVCTTNCAWSATVRMAGALVENLGEGAAGGARAFPTPEAMASAPESFYREIVRAGYRSAYLHDLAAGVVSGEFEVEELAHAQEADLPDEEGCLPVGASWNRPVWRGAHDDAPWEAFPAHPGLLDASDICAAKWAERNRLSGRATVSTLWLIQRTRVLALPDARLGLRAAEGLTSRGLDG